MRSLFLFFLVCFQVHANLPTLHDIHGNQHSLFSIRSPATKAIVYVFLDTQCPDVQRYMEPLKALHNRYNSFEKDRRGFPTKKNADGKPEAYRWPGDPVEFVGVYSRAPFVSVQDVAAHALKNHIPFRVTLDKKQEVLKHFKATNYTEAIVVDAKNLAVVYQGPISDQYQRGSSKAVAQHNYVQDVVDVLIKGDTVTASVQVMNSGCIVPRLEDVSYDESLTYYKDIEPIFQAKCQECHRPGAAGPIELMTFEDVQNNAEAIYQLVHDKQMPPFPGNSPFKLQNDRRLSKSEWTKVVSWLRGDRKAGDSSKRVPPKTFDDVQEWKIGKPDFIAKMDTPFQCPKDGVVDYVYVPIEIPDEIIQKHGVDGTLYIQSVETKPGKFPQVMHHIQVHEYLGKIDKTTQNKGGGAIQGLNALDLLFLYGPSILGAKRLAGYEPGDQDNARIFSDALGMALKSNIIVELHLTPDGKSEYPIQVEVGFKFTKTKPKRVVETNYFYRKRGDFIVPGNLKSHSLQGLFPFSKHIRVESIRGHCHSACTKLKLEKVGKREFSIADLENQANHYKDHGSPLLDVPVWDFNWQVTYKFDEPQVILEDESVLGTAFFDNTSFNLRRQLFAGADPLSDIVWGQQIQQEMFNVLFLYEELEDSDPLVIAAKKARVKK